MPKPGDVVIADFPGTTGVKIRPAVVVSSDLYHTERPDLILDVVTTNILAAVCQTDYVLQDWSLAGLRSPSAFRCFLAMARPTSVRQIGRLSDRDWDEVRARVQLAVG